MKLRNVFLFPYTGVDVDRNGWVRVIKLLLEGDGWVVVGDRFLKYFSTGKSFNDADKFCTKFAGHIVYDDHPAVNKHLAERGKLMSCHVHVKNQHIPFALKDVLADRVSSIDHCIGCPKKHSSVP